MKTGIDDRVAELEEELRQLREQNRQLEMRLTARIEQSAIQLREMIRNLPTHRQVISDEVNVSHLQTAGSTSCPTDPRYQCATHGPACPNRPKE